MAHTYSSLTCHVIFSTKDRLPLIVPEARDGLYAYMAGIINNGLGYARKVGGTAGHVHVLADIRTTVCPADLLRDLKSNSSRWMNETFPARGRFAWQTGYGIFSVSFSAIPSVRQYIERQAEHHRAVTFKEEFLKFLERHRIEYDDRFIWE